MFKLISATPSPCARKVRVALQEKGLPFELVTEVPWDTTPKYNPLEKLPVLILEDGSSVYESSLQYLELKYTETPLLPEDVDGRLEARRFEVLCDGVCDAVVLTFFESLRADQASPECWRDSAERLRAAYARCRACSGIDPSLSGRNSVSGTSRSGPSSATFQSALPNLTGGAIIRILRRLAPA